MSFDESRRRRPTENGGEHAGQRSHRPPWRSTRDDPQTRGSRSLSRVDVPRQVALDVVTAVRERDAYANLVLPQLLRKAQLGGRDAAFATELAYGTTRARGLIDAILASAAQRPVEDIEPEVLDILQLGAYQLLRTRVGSHAAVDTSVNAAADRIGLRATGFVNAVLRKVAARSEEEWVDRLAPAMRDDRVAYLAFRYAHPVWIAREFARVLDSTGGDLQAALAANDDRPIVHLAARPGEMTAEELALVSGGEVGHLSPYAVYLLGGDPADVDAVRQGLATVQDEGSQLVARAVTEVELIGPDQGRWLDLCAGPGGKAAMVGAIAGIVGAHLDAVEPSAHRAGLVSTSTKNLPVTVHQVDGRASGLTPGYDRILVDAPCSGIGALRRRPEARWRKTPDDIAELAVLQHELLTEAIALLRPGGVVVYSTCSPHLDETIAVVRRVIAEGSVEQLDTRTAMPVVGGGARFGDGPHVQLWPHRHGTDAMFMTALRKVITDDTCPGQ